MLGFSSLVRLILPFPAAREHIIQRILKCAAVHVDQTLLFLGLRIADDRNEAQVPSQLSAQVSSDRKAAILVHLHEVDHGLIMKHDVTLGFLDLLTLGLTIRMIP